MVIFIFAFKIFLKIIYWVSIKFTFHHFWKKFSQSRKTFFFPTENFKKKKKKKYFLMFPANRNYCFWLFSVQMTHFSVYKTWNVCLQCIYKIYEHHHYKCLSFESGISPDSLESKLTWLRSASLGGKIKNYQDKIRCYPMHCSQTPPFMGFLRQEYCSRLPFPSPIMDFYKAALSPKKQHDKTDFSLK